MQSLSVDLGTSNTVAVLSAHGRPPRAVEVDGSVSMPSAVFAEEGGHLIVGRDAERRARLDPTRFEPNPKRRVDEQTLLLGTDVVSVTEALAAVLRRVLDETTRQLGGQQPEQVQLTHPAQWGPVRRDVLLSAARLAATAGTVTLVPEPVAAAAHFASFPGKALAPGQALAVYDLGAGTFDVAVVGATQQGYTVLTEDGLPDLGGLDVDQAMLVHVGREVSHRDPQQWQRLLQPELAADRRTRRALAEDVKAGKEALSRHPQTEVPMPEPFTDVLVTRGELEGLVRPTMQRTVELLASTLRSAGLSAGNLAGIYLVGGSSRLPLVGSMIGEQLGVVPSSLDQPETAVAYGAHHVSTDGTSMRDQNRGNQITRAEAYGARSNTGTTPAAPTVAELPSPPAGYPTAGTSPQPGTEPHPGQQTTIPTDAGSDTRRSGRKRKKLLLGALVAAVVLLALSGTFYFTSGNSVTTYSAAECKQPGKPGADDFTGCLRQLAGTIADSGQCKTGMGSGPASAKGNLGVSVTCPAPGLAGAQMTYIHGKSSATLQSYTDRLLNSTGGSHQVRAKWKGNALTGSYIAESGKGSSVLVYRVNDRPLVGFIYQLNLDGSDTTRTAAQLADYFEQRIQPGT